MLPKVNEVVLKFSRRIQIEEQFKQYAKEQTTKARDEGVCSEFEFVAPSIQLFCVWLTKTDEGHKVLKELTESV